MTRPTFLKTFAALAGAAALSALALPAAAADSPAFAAFRDLCVAGRAAAAPALKAADADGWVEAPEGSFDTSELDDFTSVEIRVKAGDASVGILLVGEGAIDEMPGASAIICIVGFMPADAEGLAREAAAFARVPPAPKDAVETEDDEDVTLYFYSDGPAGRRSLADADDDDAEAEIRAGRVEGVMFMNSGGVSMVGLIIPRI